MSEIAPKLPPIPYEIFQRISGSGSDVLNAAVDYAAFCVLQERERCALLCDAETEIAHGEFGKGWVEGARTCAAAIREG